MPISVPSAPENLNVDTIDHESVSVMWSLPRSRNGIVFEYQILYSGYTKVDGERELQNVMFLSG